MTQTVLQGDCLEVLRTLPGLDPVALHLDENGVAAPQHVLDDAGRADAFTEIVLVKG